MAVLAIGRNHGIRGSQRLHCADGDRLFANVEMQKTADLLLLIQLGAFLLEAADADHSAQQRQQVLARQMRLRGINAMCRSRRLRSLSADEGLSVRPKVGPKGLPGVSDIGCHQRRTSCDGRSYLARSRIALIQVNTPQPWSRGSEL